MSSSICCRMATAEAVCESATDRPAQSGQRSPSASASARPASVTGVPGCSRMTADQRREQPDPDDRGPSAHGVDTPIVARCSAIVSALSGPNCFERTIPSASTKKVSGGPVTPKSTPTRPFLSTTCG